MLFTEMKFFELYQEIFNSWKTRQHAWLGSKCKVDLHYCLHRVLRY